MNQSLNASVAPEIFIPTFADAASWIIEATQKLEKLAVLKPDWDSHGGLPLKPGARERALLAIRLLQNEPLPTPNVVLGSGGTVQLEWRRDGKELDLDLADENAIEYVKCDAVGNIEEGFADWSSSQDLLTLARWFLEK